MSATVAAALKKIAVAILTDKKLRKTFLGIVLGIIVIIVMPFAAIIALFNGGINIDTNRLQTLVVQNMSAEEQARLQRVEDLMYEIEDMPHILPESLDSRKRNSRMFFGQSVISKLPRRTETTMRNTSSERFISTEKRSSGIMKKPPPICPPQRSMAISMPSSSCTAFNPTAIGLQHLVRSGSCII